MATVLYFGAWSRDQLGHYLWSPGKWTSRRLEDMLPFPVHILDSGLLPPNRPQEQGVVHRSHVNGWTILSFWDRSSDSRPKSNSAFVIEGVVPTDEGLLIARQHFPEKFQSFGFELKEQK